MKTIKKENFRVTVEPWDKGYRPLTEKELLQSCNSIVAEIKRHIDNVGHVYIDYDASEVCSFCGYSWEKEWDTQEPQCCQKAIDEYNKILEETK